MEEQIKEEMQRIIVLLTNQQHQQLLEESTKLGIGVGTLIKVKIFGQQK